MSECGVAVDVGAAEFQNITLWVAGIGDRLDEGGETANSVVWLAGVGTGGGGTVLAEHPIANIDVRNDPIQELNLMICGQCWMMLYSHLFFRCR